MKLPGKTAYSGRRRPTRVKSGFASHPDSTGGAWRSETTECIKLTRGAVLEIAFEIPKHNAGSWVAFGGWYCGDEKLTVEVHVPRSKHTLIPPSAPDWSKFGSMWRGDGVACTATLCVSASANTEISIYDLGCGVVESPGCHTTDQFVECDKASYLENLHQLSPEAHFWKMEGTVSCSFKNSDGDVQILDKGVLVVLKTCNRCARFLPINTHDERIQLSFSNHCVARRPCVHTGFGKLRHADTGELLELDYGYQLECRYCKKYCVNAALNFKRTGAQMKEDGARRRYFELLIAEMFQMSSQLAFKHRTGQELANYVWENFERKCFGCGETLRTVQTMHLDHTRPLAMLWPLDETGTALCGPCNSSKSDRSPKEFYAEKQLKELSEITKIPLGDLIDPTPNMQVVYALMARLDWFFNSFLTSEVMTRERDGKVAAELVVKALQKTLDRCPGGAPIDLVAEYQKRRSAQNRT